MAGARGEAGHDRREVGDAGAGEEQQLGSEAGRRCGGPEPRSRGGAAAQLDEEARAASGAPGGGSGGRARAAGREQGRALAAGERWRERRPARAAAGAAAGWRVGDGLRSLLPRWRMRRRQLRRGPWRREQGGSVRSQRRCHLLLPRREACAAALLWLPAAARGRAPSAGARR